MYLFKEIFLINCLILFDIQSSVQVCHWSVKLFFIIIFLFLHHHGPTVLSEWLALLCTRVGWLSSTAWAGMILETTTTVRKENSNRQNVKCHLFTWGRLVERQQRSVLTEIINVEKWWNSKLDTFCCYHPMVYHWHWLLPRSVGQNHNQDSL